MGELWLVTKQIQQPWTSNRWNKGRDQKSSKPEVIEQNGKCFSEWVLFKQQLEPITKELLEIMLLSLKPRINNNLWLPLAFCWSYRFYSLKSYSHKHIFKLSTRDRAEYLHQVLTWTLSNILKEGTATLVTMTKRYCQGKGVCLAMVVQASINCVNLSVPIIVPNPAHNISSHSNAWWGQELNKKTPCMLFWVWDVPRWLIVNQ